MTKEEATIYIKEWLKDEYLDCKDRAALTAIIKESEQEPCGKDINVPATDAISRKAVLDKLNRLIEVERLQGTDEMGYGRERVSAYECMMHAVESEYLYPTIQPQPKTQATSEIDNFVSFLIRENCEGCKECEPRLSADWKPKFACVEEGRAKWLLSMANKYKAESEN